jgi:single-strand DNA-binding protein
MNRVELIGNLGRAVEIKQLASGKVVGRTLLAIDRVGKREGTDWVRLVLWDKTATNAARYLAKGSKVGVSGHISSEFYERKPKDGGDGPADVRLNTEVIVDQIEYLSPPPNPNSASPGAKGTR